MRLAPPDAAASRVAIVGVGSELNGDDGAGVQVVRGLVNRVSADVLLLEGGPAPENMTGALRRFGPRTVVLVDAADFCDTPGEIAWIASEEADGLSASTHTLPPTLLARYLAHELGCRMLLLAIQPRSLVFGQPLSPEVGRAVDDAIESIVAWLTPTRPPTTAS